VRRLRRLLVPKFPYGLLYRVEPDRIYVIAVMHLHNAQATGGHGSERVLSDARLERSGSQPAAHPAVAPAGDGRSLRRRAQLPA